MSKATVKTARRTPRLLHLKRSYNDEMNTIFWIFTWMVRRTMSRATYDARCRRFEHGWGFRWLGFDWFKPSWFGQ